MATLKLGISKLNASDLILKVQMLINKLTGNVNFPTPSPTLVELGDALSALGDAAVDATSGDHAKIALRNLKDRDMRNLIRELGVDIQSTSKGDAEKIISSGFELRKTPEPVGIPAIPENLSTKPSETGGIIETKWKAVRGAKSYRLEYLDLGVSASLPETPEEMEDTADDDDWKLLDISTKSRYRITGLSAGHLYYFRVAAIGAAGQGPFSDIAARRAA